MDAKLLYISIDNVFGGTCDRHREPDDKRYNFANVYGQSKLSRERVVESVLKKFYILGASGVFGLNDKNFIKTIIDVGRTRKSVKVVDDQVGTPTYTRDLARLLVDVVETEKYCFYHATNSECEPGEYISWAV